MVTDLEALEPQLDLVKDRCALLVELSLGNKARGSERLKLVEPLYWGSGRTALAYCLNLAKGHWGCGRSGRRD